MFSHHSFLRSGHRANVLPQKLQALEPIEEEVQHDLTHFHGLQLSVQQYLETNPSSKANDM